MEILHGRRQKGNFEGEMGGAHTIKCYASYRHGGQTMSNPKNPKNRTNEFFVIFPVNYIF